MRQQLSVEGVSKGTFTLGQGCIIGEQWLISLQNYIYNIFTDECNSDVAKKKKTLVLLQFKCYVIVKVKSFEQIPGIWEPNQNFNT